MVSSFYSSFVLLIKKKKKKNWCKFSDDTQRLCLMLLFKLALTNENNSLSQCIVLSVLQKSTFKEHAQSKDIFSVFFFSVSSSLITEVYPFICFCANAQSKRYISYEHITTYYDFVLYTVYIQNQVYLFIFEAS